MKARRSDNLHAAHALRLALAGWFQPPDGLATGPARDWPQILELARATKTIGLLLRGLSKSGNEPPAEIATKLAAINEELVKRNFANFLETEKLRATLAAADVPMLVLKGPLRAYEIYGDWGLRGSSDIDVLVPRALYRKAAEALQDAGYLPLVSPDSRWWHDYLKESPFRPPAGMTFLVDLHHGVQQPGGPSPDGLESFFAESRELVVGGRAVRVPAPGHALLIAAVGFGKAVFASEPWAVYAHEIAQVMTRASAGQAGEFRRIASQSGMLRLFDMAVASACALFSLPDCPVPEDARIYREEDDLLLSAMGLGGRGKFHRLRHMWRWTDGGGPDRSLSFATSTGRLAMSEIVRRQEGL
ncbi:hypothetical protein FHS61_000553 [Altererythrobacter atlanticus]|uniref:Uncharacterized protein n=1 Tax=Croceibacterium atlanticum TaxID=1267766 RepID=A0A0F7KT54_9SPHN|nr:nucleotidyltransferase family protein [Croceibacterium atlanticum]AKH42779.1 hypothetical protein WYH_01743 [Croceibacterium atlanticum]MBB5731560.1 hypothetical protein [Croceibacterium atlanticum]